METGQDVLTHDQPTPGDRLNELCNSNDGEQSSSLNTPISFSPSSSPARQGSTPKERKVSFPDDSSLVRSVEPFDPWKNGKCVGGK